MGRLRSVALAMVTLAALVVATHAQAQMAPVSAPVAAPSVGPTTPQTEPGTDQPVAGTTAFDPATSTPDDAQTTPIRRVLRNQNRSYSAHITNAPARVKTVN